MNRLHSLEGAVTGSFGSTVALFANLASLSAAFIEVAKLRIMIGSVLTTLLGYLILRIPTVAEVWPRG